MRLISRTTCSPTPGILHCRGQHNPVGYIGPGGLDWIDLGRLDTKTLASVGESRISAANVVSVGRRLDGKPSKFIGLRPDHTQDGSEQLEWTFERAEFDGKDGKVQANDIAVWRHRQRCRMLLAPTKDCREFRIVFRLHLTGLKVVEQYGEFWLYSTLDGGFRFRIREPAICDPKTQEPVRGKDDEPIRGLVRHSLVKDSDGTYLYVKDCTAEFTRAVTDGLLPDGFLVDADTYYSSTADGYVSNRNADWAALHDATSGYAASTSATQDNDFASAFYASSLYKWIYRSFLYFDTTAATAPTACTLNVTASKYGESTVSAQKGEQAASLTTADFDAFSGTLYGYNSNWPTSGTASIAFDATGVSEINLSGETKICCREYTHDYLDATCGTSDFQNGARYSDYTGTESDPKLLITEYYAPHVMIVY